MPKEVFKIEGFHGGLNSNSDPRDIRQIESPSIQDVAIDSVGKIKTLGSFDNGNVFHSGTTPSTLASTQITLASSASGSDDFYNGYSIFITTGQGIGQERKITDYTGSSKSCIISPAWDSPAPTGGSGYEIRGDGNEISILKNRGLFTMSSDRQLDGGSANETLIFLHDNANHTIDVNDSEGWDTALINMGGSSIPIYYTADGVIRVSDASLTQNSQWFGYISDEKFDGLNADSGAIGWYNAEQSLTSPTSGKCLISTPEIGTDTNGINSSSSEYIGNVINDGSSPYQVVNHSAVNLRVGIQLNEILFDSNHSDWTQDERCAAQANDSPIHSCIGTKVTRMQGNNTTKTTNFIVKNSLSFSYEENNSLIIPIFITSSEINKLIKFQIELGKTDGSGKIGGTSLQLPVSSSIGIVDKSVSSTGIRWEFGAEKIKPNMWNFLVCSSDNISNNSELFPMSDCDYIMITMKDRAVLLAGGSTDKMDYYISGIALADSQSLNAYTPGTYTFHHTYLYDEENKQESLPFKFSDVSPSSSFTLTGSINVTGANTNVPGSGTKFLTELAIGDEITVSGETRIINTITDDTTATVTVAWGSDLANDTSPDCNPIGEYDNVNSINIVGSSVLFNFDTYICSNNSSPAYAFNKRISGSRLYYKVEENDNYFLIGELDFIEKGFKFIPEADTLSYIITNATDNTAPILSKIALIKEISPDSANTVDTFKTINGFSTEVKSLDAKYKTAVVHGRRVYIGNIKRPDGKTHPDRIIKSQVNRFDTFPEGMGSVDVVIRDGENIVKLEAYADRILQFKQHSLYIINVSESVDFLEDTFRNKGCAFNYHVVRTDLGIAWFNDHGCYLYDGKSVIHLLEKQGIRLISEDDWSLFVKDGTDDLDMSSAMIGYVPKKKHLIIKNENNDIYLYDFVLQSWTIGSGKVTESTAMTNFALDGDQNLFYIDNTTTVRNTWQSSPQSTTSLIFKSKDIDFGQSSIRKKIYRVRINYKGDADNLVVKYSVNGDTDSPYDFEGTDASTGKPTGSTASSSKPLHDKTDLTQWHQAELKPDVSSEANNIYSFQLHMSGTVDSDFEINDISIIYRLKNVK